MEFRLNIRKAELLMEVHLKLFKPTFQSRNTLIRMRPLPQPSPVFSHRQAFNKSKQGKYTSIKKSVLIETFLLFLQLVTMENGYKLELVSEFPTKFRCPFCEHLMRDPIQTSRGELACGSCYMEALRYMFRHSLGFRNLLKFMLFVICYMQSYRNYSGSIYIFLYFYISYFYTFLL